MAIYQTGNTYCFPPEKIPNTGGGGNYDVEQNGDYLINYGNFKGDTVRTLFESRNSKDELLARYAIDPNVLAYRVHKLDGWRPGRPEVKQVKDSLSVNSSNETTWYEIGSEKHTATVAGHGNSFKPEKKGLYCAVLKYGIGYVVSKPTAYTR